MTLQHHLFYTTDINISDLFKNTKSLNEYLNKSKKDCEKYIKKQYPPNTIDYQEKFNKLYGDIFEVFCELFIKLTKYHPECRFYDYEPTEVDYPGIDGIGKRKGKNGCDIVTLFQFKGHKYNSSLTGEDGVTSFRAESYKILNEMGIFPNTTNVDEPKNLVILTTGKGLSFYQDDNYGDLIQVLDREFIQKITDYNSIGGSSLFWEDAYEIVKEKERTI